MATALQYAETVHDLLSEAIVLANDNDIYQRIMETKDVLVRLKETYPVHRDALNDLIGQLDDIVRDSSQLLPTVAASTVATTTPTSDNASTLTPTSDTVTPTDAAVSAASKLKQDATANATRPKNMRKTRKQWYNSANQPAAERPRPFNTSDSPRASFSQQTVGAPTISQPVSITSAAADLASAATTNSTTIVKDINDEMLNTILHGQLETYKTISELNKDPRESPIYDALLSLTKTYLNVFRQYYQNKSVILKNNVIKIGRQIKEFINKYYDIDNNVAREVNGYRITPILSGILIGIDSMISDTISYTSSSSQNRNMIPSEVLPILGQFGGRRRTRRKSKRVQ